MLVTVMIETLEGVANAEEIAATHGVDVVILGNNDLSSFSGWAQNDPRYQDAPGEGARRGVEVRQVPSATPARSTSTATSSAPTRGWSRTARRETDGRRRRAAAAQVGARAAVRRRPDAAVATTCPSPTRNRSSDCRPAAGRPRSVERRKGIDASGTPCDRRTFSVVCAHAAPPSKRGPHRPASTPRSRPPRAKRSTSTKCSACHGDDLGGREQAPALGGGAVCRVVGLAGTCGNCSTASSRCRRPRPRACRPRTRSAVLAFLLATSEMPSGPTALADRSRTSSREITFERARVAAAAPAVPNAPRAGGAAPCWRRAPRSSSARRSRAGGAQARRRPGPSTGWPTYGGNLASHRYSPADQITKDNFNRLEIAWRLKTDFLGPRPDTLYSATPLVVDRVLYTTAGMRRAAIALNAATGEMLWMHCGGRRRARAERAAQRRRSRRRLLGRPNGADRRIIYVTPGYRMLALDAKTGCADSRRSDATAPSI